MLFISSLFIPNVIVPDQSIFLWIAASFADDAAVNANDTKMLLANGLGTSFIKSKSVLKNYLEILMIVLFYATEFLLILY